MIDEVYIKNASSVKCTFDLLTKAIVHPEDVPMALLEACKSQGALAALEISEHGIRQMSLNTLKSHSDSNSLIRWEQLDSLRKAALSAYQMWQKNSKNKLGRGSKAGLKVEAENSKQELQVKNNEIIQFIDCYQDLLNISRDHAKLDSMFAAKFEKHMRKYSYLNQCNNRNRLRVIDGKQKR